MRTIVGFEKDERKEEIEIDDRFQNIPIIA